MEVDAQFLRLSPLEWGETQSGETELANVATITHITADDYGTEIHSLDGDHHVAESFDRVARMLVDLGSQVRFLGVTRICVGVPDMEERALFNMSVVA